MSEEIFDRDDVSALTDYIIDNLGMDAWDELSEETSSCINIEDFKDRCELWLINRVDRIDHAKRLLRRIRE